MGNLFATLFLIAFSLPSILAQCTTPAPSDRYYYDLASVDDKKLYVFGGTLNKTYMDTWALDLSQQVDTSCPPWSQSPPLATTQSISSYIYGVAFSPNNKNNYIYLQGGDAETTGIQRTPVIYDTLQGNWLLSSISGSMTPRSQMTATVDKINNKVWIFGGRVPFEFGMSGNINTFNDLYYYQVSESGTALTITQASITSYYGSPAARFGHTTTLVNNRLITLGGYVKVNDTTKMITDFASAFVYDINTGVGVAMETLGDIPSARTEFSAVAAQDGQSIIIFGGVTADDLQNVTNDVYILDTCTLTWRKQEISGHADGRALHQAYMHGQFMITMLGISGHNQGEPIPNNNLSILDTNLWSWTSSIPSGYSPAGINSSPSCSFTFPAPPAQPQTHGNAPKIYDTTVISNPNAPSTQLTSSEKGGIGVGVPLFIILCLGAAFFFYRRHQRNKTRQLNPRWMPGALSTKSEQEGNNYPMFNYNDQPSTGLRTYTASDHDQWERQLIQDEQRPQDDTPMARHEEIWSRMRGLHAPADEERR
ncbi:uncharacterized protein BX664DRAFT_285653 [Halteromyces radiatus]|uniref:uncharacterized protein n=1 Tax=Halteromyces radiatus TaxID=101107 RepID=UPI00221EA299|nr:uncharacterized protein BX664DRAFT_285653 [Halteromyces radiatus]KAI8081554.1 hypothetical protein BX664DRAFT_285653 [Halteromyces radiatus]